MKNKIWWIVGIGAVAYFISKSGGLSAIIGKKGAVAQPGLAPAYNAVLTNPSADNVSALISAGGGAFSTISGSLAKLFGGSGSGPANTPYLSGNSLTAAMNYDTSVNSAADYFQYNPVPDTGAMAGGPIDYSTFDFSTVGE